ncbi:MAG TPA: hypothetical protein VEL76_03935 [Gemmataceae bacterium]|nr:hypothetical protein [Gemmataceae bacterium]
MPRMYPLVPAVFLAILLPGCSRDVPAPVAQAPGGPVAGVPGKLPLDLPGGEIQQVQFPPALEADKQTQYETALQDAFNLLAQRKYPEALTALEAARTIKDSPFLQTEIAKLKIRLDQDAAAEQTLHDIQTVLDQGKAAEAGQLATFALQQYGASDVAPRLVKLKLQADALTAMQLTDNPARQQRFRDDAAAALKEKNLRAAALAFEQALQYGDDANLRKQLDDVKAALQRYDENRARACELRRDPASLEDALALLNDAAKAWDTLQVRQEIDEYAVALQQRRERVSVADFEVRGDVGLPAAGQTLADELLPALKPKFDLVERSQIAKVLGELKLTAVQLAESGGDQRELGRLAKLRYLVVGSVSQIGGITVHARLVDVRTGLIVQTAKIVAPEPNQLVAQMPELARLLMMTDEQRMVYEKEQAQVAQLPPPPPVDAPLPPPPEVPVADVPPPPPIVLETCRPPAVGGIVLQDFERLPPPPAVGQPVPVVAVAAEGAVKRRMLAVSLEVGDNLFRRGRFREAMRHFEFGLSLSPGHFDLQVRLDRCRPLLPPPPPPEVIVVVQPPPPPPRPRVSFLDFVVLGDPAVVPPPLGSWTPQNLAPYFSPPYEIVDRGEVFWWMGRMGMTMRDLMTDPAARRWLGRALNVRYFLLGNLRQTASFDATTYLLDAEDGFLVGSGRIHVRTPHELKLRLGELAQLTLMSPAERLQYEKQTQPVEVLVVQAQESHKRGDFQLAINLFEKAGKLRVGSIEIEVHLQNARRAAERAALEEARRREAERIQAEALAWQQRQLELAHRAEEARRRAAEQTAVLAAEQRRIMEEERLRQLALAQAQMVLQARVAFKRGDIKVSLQLFEGASALRPDEGVYRELAQARAELDRVARQRAAEEQALREAQLRRLREEELARTRRQLEAEREARRLQELALRKTQEARDAGEYQRLFDEGQQRLARQEYDAAISLLQSARRVRKTDAVEALLNQAMTSQARAIAQKQGDAERRALEARLAKEHTLRLQAEADAKRNQDLYTQALQLAQKAMAEKNYDTAYVKYQEAGKFYKTDLVLNGLRQADAARTEVRTQAALAIKRKTEAAQSDATVKRLVGEGQAALAANQHDKAVQAFTQAKALAPTNVEVLTGLTKAEQVRERAALDLRRQTADQERQKTFARLLESGQANLANKQYDAAVLSLTEALKVKPGDPTALQAKAQAEKLRQQTGTDALAAAKAKQQADAYQKAMSAGRLALQGKQYDAAIKSFSEAQTLLPGDQSSANFLKDAQKAQTDAAAVLAAQAKQRADEVQRAASLQKALSDGRAALATGNLKGAADAFGTAAKLAPKDAAVLAAQEDLRKAQAAKDSAATAQRQRQEQYQNLINAGRTALAGKNYDAAEKAFAQAATLLPGDRASQELLKQAQKGRADALAAAGALKQKQADAQRAEQIRQLLTNGRAALKTGQLDAAAKAFAEADRLAPKDAAVAAAMQELEQARRAAAATAAVAAKQKAERVGQLVAAGRKALAANQLDEAGRNFTEAAKLAPTDPAVVAAQRDLDQARRNATTAAEAAKKAAEADKAKRQASYQQAITSGQQAMAAKRFDDAIKAFTLAGQLLPGDATATTLLNQARTAQTQDTQQKAAAQRQADFNKLTAQGQAAMAAKRYADAVKAYGDALKLIPNDPTVTQRLREANTALEASRKTAPPPPPNPAYVAQMQAGAAQEKQQKFADALKAYQAALKIVPGDAKATERVRYTTHMAEGQRLHVARQFAAAVREYEAALQLVPNDPAATAALKRAKAGQP